MEYLKLLSFIILLSLTQLPLAVAQSIDLNLPTAISASVMSDSLNPTGTVIIYYASDTTVTSTLQAATLPPSPTGPDTSSMIPLLTDTLANPSVSSTITIGISTPTPLSSGTISLASPTAVSSTTDSLMSPSSTTVWVTRSSSSSSMMSTSTTATTSTSSAGAAATNIGMGLGGVLGAAAGVIALL